MSPPSAVLRQLLAAQSTSASSSATIALQSAPIPASSASPSNSSHQDKDQATTLGLDIGLGAGMPIVIFSVIGFSVFRRWRQGKLGRRPEQAVLGKAELPGKDAEKQFGELGPDGQVGEMSGASKPVEADRRSLAAELEGEWHGHEAPTR